MDIHSLLNKRFICSFCGREHYIPIKKIVTKKRAVSLLSAFLLDLVKGRRVLILSDNNETCSSLWQKLSGNTY